MTMSADPADTAVAAWAACPPAPEPSWRPEPDVECHRGRSRPAVVDYGGEPARLLTRHADVRSALVHPGLAPHIPGVAMTDEDANASGVLFLMRGAPHARLRRVLSGALSARRVAGLRPVMRARAGTRVAVLAERVRDGGAADLMAAVAGPLATGTLSVLLGGDLTARPDVEDTIAASQGLFGTPEDIADGAARLSGTVAELVAERRAAPGDDLLSAMITDPARDGEPLTDGELHGLVFGLLSAGIAPPAQSLLLGALRLMAGPDGGAALAGVRADPGRLPAVVDELLRLDPGGLASVDRVLRATEDVDLAGVRIHEGELVLLSLGAANRDPTVFADPHALREDRGAARHLSFAPGVHHCLGAALARAQLEIGLEAILEGLPDLVPAIGNGDGGGDGDVLGALDWRVGLFRTRTLAALPVTRR